MTEENTEPKLLPRKQTLVQSKLTSAFFHPTTSNHSPYFRRPTSHPAASPDSPIPLIGTAIASDTNDATSPPLPKINLYPERRAPTHRPPPSLPSTTNSTLLSLVASETKLLLPSLLSSAPHAPPTGHFFHPRNLPPLPPSACPKLPPANIQVLNADSIDTALTLSRPSAPPVLILNMANAHRGGGGWLKGAIAQEESLCYRSSLSFTLKRHFYPLPDYGAIYSPTVLVLRESLAAGHTLLDLASPQDLPVVSVVSVAAVRDPQVEGGQGEFGQYKYPKVRAVMKEKMRVVLRVAATRGHRVLVLGALGCGAFGNPRGEVVACWGEVLAEMEFRGGWWEEVVFAVMEEGGEREGEGNYGVFWRGLNGVEV